MEQTQETPTFVLAAIIAAMLMAALTGCTVSGSVDWYGQTAKDERTISPSLYPQSVNQARKDDQRY